MTFEGSETVEGADVIVTGDVEADEGEVVVVDKFPFITVRPGCQLWHIAIISRRTYNPAKARRLIQILSLPKLELLVADA